MKTFGKEDIFINTMLEETFRFIPENDASLDPEDLLSYFDEQGNNADGSGSKQFFEGQLKKHKLNYIPFGFLSEINCFRISIAGSIVDLPNNWSIFKNLYEDYKSGKSASFFISIEEDTENLLEIFRPFSSYDCNLVFLNLKGSLYLIFLPENDQKLIDWIEFFVGSLI